MKVLWIVLGVLGGLCLICAAGSLFLFSKGKAVFDDAGKYGDEAFTAIARDWSISTFKTYAAPEIEQQNGPQAVPDLLARLKEKLGPLKTFTSHVTGVNSKTGLGTTADWNAEAIFERGAGAVTMQLISRDGKWQVLKFNVDSPLLTQDGVQPKNEEPNQPTTTGGGDSDVIR